MSGNDQLKTLRWESREGGEREGWGGGEGGMWWGREGWWGGKAGMVWGKGRDGVGEREGCGGGKGGMGWGEEGG